MKFGKMGVAALAMTMFAASYQPAQAFVGKPVPVAVQAIDGNVIEVGRRGFHRGYRRGYRHRGYRGYRRNRGRYIAGGLIAGALIGSALAAPRYYERSRYRSRPRVIRAGRAHTNWCFRRYKSYRAYDNTFQPYNGRRRACLSPYN